jgi:hypothetical protein
LANTPIIGRPEKPAEDDERHRDPVRRLVDVVVDLVDPRVLDVHLERALAQLLEHVRDLVRHVLATDASPTPRRGHAVRARAGWNRSASSPRAYGFATSKTLNSG